MISLIQTAEGALNETHAILQRMRELAVQSSNDTNTDADRAELQKEVNQLASALNDIAKNTEFNTKSLLDGTFEGTFHVGANSGQNLKIEIGNMGASSLNVGGVEGASFAVTATLSDADDFADGDYTVVKLDDGATLEDGTEIGYALQNSSGDIVAVSEDDGATYTKLSTAVAINDLSKSGVVGSEKIDFGTLGDPVISGTVTIDGTSVTATGTVVNTDLADGTYTVSTTHGGLGSSTHGLVDEKGNLVAVSDDGQAWTSYSDGSAVLTTNTALTTAGTEITVGSGEGLNISTQKSADKAITTIQSAIDNVSAERSKLGAVQNRLEHTINNLGTSSENLTAAESRIRDVDHTEAA